MASIGETIARLRADRGLTLKQLSRLSGVSSSHISAIENETRPNPSIGQVMKLAKAFGVSLACFDDAHRDAHGDAAEMAGHVDAVANPHTNTAAWAGKLTSLYDAETRAFIASESSRPYVALAKRLAEDATQDPSQFLQLIAQFMRDRQIRYNAE